MLAKKGSWALGDQMVRTEGKWFSGGPGASVPDTHFSSTASRISGGAAGGKAFRACQPPFFPPRPRSTDYHGPADSGQLPYCQC